MIVVGQVRNVVHTGIQHGLKVSSLGDMPGNGQAVLVSGRDNGFQLFGSQLGQTVCAGIAVFQGYLDGIHAFVDFSQHGLLRLIGGGNEQAAVTTGTASMDPAETRRAYCGSASISAWKAFSPAIGSGLALSSRTVVTPPCAQACKLALSKPQCTWALMKPGRMVAPPRSMVVTPAGTLRLLAGPTARILSLQPGARLHQEAGLAPVPSIRVAFTRASVAGWSVFSGDGPIFERRTRKTNKRTRIERQRL